MNKRAFLDVFFHLANNKKGQHPIECTCFTCNVLYIHKEIMVLYNTPTASLQRDKPPPPLRAQSALAAEYTNSISGEG